MTCEFHTHCAYPDPTPERCFCCHASWVKITAPARRITTRPGVSKSGEPLLVVDVHYLDGYGEMPLNHFWRHAEIARKASKRGEA